MLTEYDVIIIGAGASGLMCAIEAGKRKRSVLILDHANKAGKKILMSGGGRCNFTNYQIEAENYLSSNPHFCKSAFSRYTQWDFLALVNAYQIPFHERDHGQLFCDNSARDILRMLLNECEKNRVVIRLDTAVGSVRSKEQGGFIVNTDTMTLRCTSLVIASGGLSIPKMGASPFGYRIASQFGINVVKTAAGLVPFTWTEQDSLRYAPLAGIAVPAVVDNGRHSFAEKVLFTHRGLSGPAILQISSYWHPGESVSINLLPALDVGAWLTNKRQARDRRQLKTLLAKLLPKRLVETLLPAALLSIDSQNLSDKQIASVVDQIHNWQIRPNGTEGYRTAEVTIGGVDCHALSSRTMEAKQVAGLYFIGEVVDVTGWLGGYNFQWAWSSGWCAGQHV